MEEAVFHFLLDGKPVSCQRYGCGHINRTYLVKTDAGRRYIFQRINSLVFPDIKGLMENIAAVTGFLAARVEEPRGSLRLVPALDGAWVWVDGEGESWRVYDFIEDSLCLQQPERPEDLYESAVAFGCFQNQLSDFPADTLHETIKDFHNTPDRYRKFHLALEADALGRAAGVREEIDFALKREAAAGALQALREDGSLPLRVTHNDTKLNNVMLDAKTRKALCVIDLDTVMPGLAAYDFGDSIRFGAATAAEDEKNLDKMGLDMSLYETYARGYLHSCRSLTALEKETLPLGAKLMTLECGLRFLTDYLEGDRYFAIARPEHNLDRARTQFRLVADMEKKWDGMRALIARSAE
ncbi:MAG: mucin desulfatase [Clostridia bacterium]|nr:aminoglycoside phosphotransferase family protein [Oscillospiraceae bacterium]MBS5432795.1 aminoglycoside phosphotransferase family protein [Bacillota bacterium]PWM19882.1 MAG: mucin desulfatase [Clostridia bacterium]